ncbi:MAG: hypothetical protein H0X29_06635 [Parachlamydiaceae bacterium]|nr:hypothetical protein [Parachlamydiaceae bacterium]
MTDKRGRANAKILHQDLWDVLRLIMLDWKNEDISKTEEVSLSREGLSNRITDLNNLLGVNNERKEERRKELIERAISLGYDPFNDRFDHRFEINRQLFRDATGEVFKASVFF